METEYLYHYTSIESLALILKNRTIRLNPLDKMDDLQEQKTADVENLGRFYFVSSWTDDTTESIPMWKMYTDPKAGVRIKMKKNPFVRHGTKGIDIVNKTGMKSVDETTLNGKLDTFLDLSELMKNGYYSVQAFNSDILKKVIYTDDVAKLEPKVLEKDEEKIHINTGGLGCYKSCFWSFQNEWRYIMMFLPVDFSKGTEEMLNSFTLTANKLACGKANPPFRYFDLDIDSECFTEMEITSSPQMTTGNRVILSALVEKYNPTAIIKESELFGKL